MSYVALYRKWRPKTFDDVKGQDAICTTLKNQIVSGRIGHAYLFCGTRGTGKTSLAKIMARAVNCEQSTDGNPCNKCGSCEAILKGSSINVIEMDAASNNKVEDARDIIDKVAYPPTEGRYKVFIIDEAHMLTPQAWNALLKTIEEPPEYMIFIFATTEVNKIPVTILSRCQRYDFKRISVETIVARLKELTEAEHIEIEDKALNYIAKCADGAMRDALSLLDECVAFHPGESISYDQVLEMLGAVDITTFRKLFEYIAKVQTTDALKVIEDVVIQGRELGQFVTDFLWYMRNILIIKTTDDASGIIDTSAENLDVMKEDAALVSREALMRYIKVIAELSNRMRYANQKRVLLELAIIKLATPQMEENMDAVLERLSSIERRLDSGDIQISSSPAAGSGNTSGSDVQKDAGKDNKKVAMANTVKLPKAQYEDLVLIRKEWGHIVEGLSGPSTSIFRETVVEPAGDNAMMIVFSSEGCYNLGSRKATIDELTDYVAANYAKTFEFKTRLKGNAERMNSIYVSEEEVEAVIHMPIEKEEE